MKKRFNEIIIGLSITFALVLSMRVVMIPTPLNLGEQIGLLSMMFDYTIRRSKDLEKEDD